MKNFHTKVALLLTPFILLSMTACNHGEQNHSSNKQLSPIVTHSSTTQPTTVAVDPHQDLQIIDDAIKNLGAPAGVDPALFEPAKSNVLGFALASLTSVEALSGKWTMPLLADTLSSYASPALVAEIANLDPDNPDQSYNIMSIFDVFTPTEHIIADPACDLGASWKQCLSSNVVFTEPVVTVETDTQFLKFSFTVSTSRNVVVDNIKTPYDMSYKMNIWVDPVTHLVVSVDNDFSFSAVSW